MCELSCLCDKEGSQQRRLERRLGGESMNGVPTENVSTHPSPPVLIANGYQHFITIAKLVWLCSDCFARIKKINTMK